MDKMIENRNLSFQEVRDDAKKTAVYTNFYNSHPINALFILQNKQSCRRNIADVTLQKKIFY